MIDKLSKKIITLATDCFNKTNLPISIDELSNKVGVSYSKVILSCDYLVSVGKFEYVSSGGLYPLQKHAIQPTHATLHPFVFSFSTVSKYVVRHLIDIAALIVAVFALLKSYGVF